MATTSDEQFNGDFSHLHDLDSHDEIFRWFLLFGIPHLKGLEISEPLNDVLTCKAAKTCQRTYVGGKGSNQISAESKQVYHISWSMGCFFVRKRVAIQIIRIVVRDKRWYI